MARFWIGTSGWSYGNWRGSFYPAGLKPGAWLGYYAGALQSVELNASFYRLPQEKTLRAWADQTPDGFLFSVKAWRAITHFRRLKGCEEHLQSMLLRLDILGDKGGPILFQLPPRFAVDLPRLDAFLALLPAGRRYAFEFRDPSWHTAAVYDALIRHNAAFCSFELAELTGPRIVTAGFVYVRLHGHRARYRGAYGEAALADWAEWLRLRLTEGRDAFVYFDNTDEADHAVRDAQRLEALLAGPESAA